MCGRTGPAKPQKCVLCVLGCPLEASCCPGKSQKSALQAEEQVRKLEEERQRLAKDAGMDNLDKQAMRAPAA